MIDFPGQMENFLHHYFIEGGITKSKAQPVTQEETVSVSHFNGFSTIQITDFRCPSAAY